MISTETVFDVLASVATIYEKLDFETWRKNLDVKGKTQNQVGVELFTFLLKNAGKIKNEIFDVVAILDGKTPDEIKAQPFSVTMASLKLLMKEPEIADFFKQAVQ